MTKANNSFFAMLVFVFIFVTNEVKGGISSGWGRRAPCYLRRIMIRRVLALAFLAGCLSLLSAQTQTAETTRYYIVFLRPDPARKVLTQAELDLVQTAHMANIHKMANDGVLVSAGPFDDTPHTISGIFVFKVDSLATAQAIAAKDPTVLKHRNTVDVHAWDGPAGIGDEYFRLHRLDPKTPENMQVHPFCIFLRGDSWESYPQRDELLLRHERYVEQLRRQGRLGAAGGIEPPDDLLGLVIFRPVSSEEAQQLMGDDPAVKAGVLKVEYHRWWSSDHVLPW